METNINAETAAHNIASAFVASYVQNLSVSIDNDADQNQLMLNAHTATQIYMFSYSEAYERINSDTKSRGSFELEF